jgi:hypothetical protein
MKMPLALPVHAATVQRMKCSLDHLPDGKRLELDFVVGVIRQGFAKAIAHRTQPRFRTGKLLKIILFGSYARGDWGRLWAQKYVLANCPGLASDRESNPAPTPRCERPL